MKKVGFIVNPIAGMGGKVGLKGTDGVYEKALELGAKPEAPNRAKIALSQLSELENEIEIYTFYGDMGEKECRDLGFNPYVLGEKKYALTTSEDTINAAKLLKEKNVDLILFAGGDGTARDIYTALGEDAVVIGIPSGVKIHSAVYATTPKKAGEMALAYIKNEKGKIKEVEVIDIDEESFRSDIVKTRLYGYLKIPHDKKYMQNRKAGSVLNEESTKRAIGRSVIDSMEADCYYIIGSGSTTRPIMRELGYNGTLLGIDLLYNKKLVKEDLREEEILDYIRGSKAKVVVTPTGGQGYIFGRGNQQLSPKVIKTVGKENIIVISALSKIISLNGESLLVDTGDLELDKELSGYVKVIIGYSERIMYKIGD